MTQPSPKQKAITLGVLLRSEPMRDVDVRPLVGIERRVSRVRLIDDVEQVRSCGPGTLVVLQGPVATAAWSVSVVIRYAWERNVPCIIGQVDPPASPSVHRLAARLDVPLGHFAGDLADLALQLTTIVGLPAATRSRIIASCAGRIVQQDSVEGVLRVIGEDLPEVPVTLAPRGQARDPGAAPDGAHLVTVPFGTLDPRTERELRAYVQDDSIEWVALVRDVLAIARAQMLACESRALVRVAERRELERWALTRITDEPGGPSSSESRRTEPAEQLGWRLDGRFVAGVVLCQDPNLDIDASLDLALAAALPAPAETVGPVRYADGWAVWQRYADGAAAADSGPEEDPRMDQARDTRRVTRNFARALSQSTSDAGLGVPLVAGVGTPGSGLAGLRDSLRHAHLAAKVARVRPDLGPPVFDQLGPAAFISGADTPDLRSVADELLTPIREADEGAALFATIAAYLDCGGSTARAAAQLGVHRNTVSSRMDRIRRLGVPIEDPHRRLVLHIAAHLEVQRASDTTSGSSAGPAPDLSVDLDVPPDL